MISAVSGSTVADQGRQTLNPTPSPPPLTRPQQGTVLRVDKGKKFLGGGAGDELGNAVSGLEAAVWSAVPSMAADGACLMTLSPLLSSW